MWRVNFGPFVFDGGEVSHCVAGEIDKVRPAVVVNSRAAVQNGLRVVVPVTDYKPYRDPALYVPLDPTATNGLTKPSAAVCAQIKSLSTSRFIVRLGVLSDDDLAEVRAAVRICLDLLDD